MKATLLALFCSFVLTPRNADAQAYVKLEGSFPFQQTLEMYSLHSTRIVIVAPGVYTPMVALTHLKPMTDSQTSEFIEKTLLHDHQMSLITIDKNFALLTWAKDAKPITWPHSVPPAFEKGTIIKAERIQISITDTNGQTWTVGKK